MGCQNENFGEGNVQEDKGEFTACTALEYSLYLDVWLYFVFVCCSSGRLFAFGFRFFFADRAYRACCLCLPLV
jgi:hypothetical protein